MKTTLQYFLVVLFNKLCKVVLTLESVDDYLHKSYWAVWCSSDDDDVK